MAGITASSVSASVGSTSADNAQSGYLIGEQIALASTLSGSTYSWSLAKPTASGARANLSSYSDAAPVFTPDVAGMYTATVTVDGATTYILRMSVTALSVGTLIQAIRFQPVTDSSVTAPPVGAMLYWSSDQDALAIKDSAGDIKVVDVTLVP